MGGAGMLLSWGVPLRGVPTSTHGWRGNPSQKGAWRGWGSLGSTCLPDAAAVQEGREPGLGSPAMPDGVHGDGAVQGERQPEEIPAWRRKSHPGWIPGHTSASGRCKGWGSLRWEGEAEQPHCWDSLGCSFLHPCDALGSCRAPACPSLLPLCSFPSLGR